MSKMMDYIAGQADGPAALLEAQIEHMGGHLEIEIEENQKLRKALECVLILLCAVPTIDIVSDHSREKIRTAVNEIRVALRGKEPTKDRALRRAQPPQPTGDVGELVEQAAAAIERDFDYDHPLRRFATKDDWLAVAKTILGPVISRSARLEQEAVEDAIAIGRLNGNKELQDLMKLNNELLARAEAAEQSLREAREALRASKAAIEPVPPSMFDEAPYNVKFDLLAQIDAALTGAGEEGK